MSTWGSRSPPRTGRPWGMWPIPIAAPNQLRAIVVRPAGGEGHAGTLGITESGSGGRPQPDSWKCWRISCSDSGCRSSPAVPNGPRHPIRSSTSSMSAYSARRDRRDLWTGPRRRKEARWKVLWPSTSGPGSHIPASHSSCPSRGRLPQGAQARLCAALR